MAEILETLAGLVIGLALIVGVFWFAFRRMPDAREPPSGQTDVTSQWTDGSGGSGDGPSG